MSGIVNWLSWFYRFLPYILSHVSGVIARQLKDFFSVVYHFYFCFVILFATFFMNSTCSNTELNNYIYKSISYAGNSLKNLLPPINNVQKTYYSCHWRIHMSRLGPFSLVVSNAAKKGIVCIRNFTHTYRTYNPSYPIIYAPIILHLDKWKAMFRLCYNSVGKDQCYQRS